MANVVQKSELDAQVLTAKAAADAVAVEAARTTADIASKAAADAAARMEADIQAAARANAAHQASLTVAAPPPLFGTILNRSTAAPPPPPAAVPCRGNWILSSCDYVRDAGGRGTSRPRVFLRKYRYNVTQQPQHGGTPCPPPIEREITESGTVSGVRNKVCKIGYKNPF